jgi:hypothetical protein
MIFVKIKALLNISNSQNVCYFNFYFVCFN